MLLSNSIKTARCLWTKAATLLLAISLLAGCRSSAATNLVTVPWGSYPLGTSATTNDDFCSIHWTGAAWVLERINLATLLAGETNTFNPIPVEAAAMAGQGAAI